MKKKIKLIVNNVKNSSYLKPFLFFSSVFFILGFLMFLFELGRNDQFHSLMDSIWWGIITFSTTGYGDKVPVTGGGRIIAVVMIFIGIGGMSFLSGTFASVFVDQNTRARRGLMDFPKMKDHYIICGWKDHMKEILHEILSVSEDISPENIIIISNVVVDKVEDLKEDKVLKGINFVRGDYFSESALERANVKSAKKVIVLADTFESAAISEVDSKTVMTVLTVKAISKDIYTCVELLDKKYENYLKQAQCDEILFASDLSRRMLANATATSGMSHIIFDLLSNEDSTRLTTLGIPVEYVGKSFGEYRNAFSGFHDMILLGVLENTGSPNRIKIEALREAQKTSDVSKLVNNLQKVKGLEINKPILVPSDDYILQRYTRAIVLEKQAEGKR